MCHRIPVKTGPVSVGADLRGAPSLAWGTRGDTPSQRVATRLHLVHTLRRAQVVVPPCDHLGSFISPSGLAAMAAQDVPEPHRRFVLSVNDPLLERDKCV